MYIYIHGFYPQEVLALKRREEQCRADFIERVNREAKKRQERLAFREGSNERGQVIKWRANRRQKNSR